jgi:O-methyltransferase/aklanonic acid methyltransferase
MTIPSEVRARVADVFDELAPVYDQGGVPWFKPIAARLVELVGPQPGEHALDIGAGRGAATFPLCQAVGPGGRVTAVDLSPAMADHLRQDAAVRGLTQLEVIAGEAGTQTLPPGAFDVVTSSLVLFFDPDPEATLRGWVQLLRPRAGRIGISTLGPIDEVWAEAEAILVAHAPSDLLDPRTSGRRGPFASTDSMKALLSSSGAVLVDSHDEKLEVVLPDAEAWRAWTMTLGFREIWRSVPEDALDDVFNRVTSVLERNRGQDGLLHLTQQVRYTTGRDTRSATRTAPKT